MSEFRFSMAASNPSHVVVRIAGGKVSVVSVFWTLAAATGELRRLARGASASHKVRFELRPWRTDGNYTEAS